MGGESVDRRVRKTKKQLRQGLTKLLQQKSVNEISVRELSDLVDINRGTFYLHYRDVYDMLDQIEREMFEEFHELLSKHSAEEMNGKPLPMLIDVFRFIAENAEMCLALLGRNGDIGFVDRLKGVVKDRCLTDWMLVFRVNRSQNLEYFYSFIVSGCIGLLQNWLESGMHETPEDMAVLAEQMIMDGIRVLK